MDRVEVFREILDKIEDSVMVTNGDIVHGPTILWVNRSFCERTGYSPEEVIGQTPKILLQSSRTSLPTRRKIREALISQVPISIEIENRTKLGYFFWADLTIYPIVGGQYFVGFNRFPSDRQREVVNLLERGLSTLVNSSREVMFFKWAFDEPWTILLASRNCQEILGYPSEDLEGTDYRDLVAPEDLQRAIKEVRQYCEEKRTSWEQKYRLITSQGILLPVIDITLVDWGKEGSPSYLYGFLLESKGGVLTRKEMEKEVAKQLSLQAQVAEICKEDGSATERVEKIKGVIEKDSSWTIHHNDRIFDLSNRMAVLEQQMTLVFDRLTRPGGMFDAIETLSKRPPSLSSVVLKNLMLFASSKAGIFVLGIAIVAMIDLLATLLPDYESLLLWMKRSIIRFFAGD